MERRSAAILVLIMLTAGAVSALHAYAKPLWYDEISTVMIARLPSVPAIWEALQNGADSTPPLFPLVCRLASKFVADDHLAFRLPSILGFMAALVCVYLILARRVDRLTALVGAAFLLYTPLATYAYEGRPYALLVGCVAGAILAWQRIDDSGWCAVALAGALAASISLHYYAVFVWPAFVLAEASVWVFERRFRMRAWAALIAGGLPLLFLAHQILKFRELFGKHYWAPATIRQALVAHGWLFDFGAHAGAAFGAIAMLTMAYWMVRDITAGPAGRVRIAEWVLTLMFLLLPVVAVTAAIVGHGGMTYRYMLPGVLGGALAIGWMVQRLPGWVKLLLLTLTVLHYGDLQQTDLKKAWTGSLLAARTHAATVMPSILSASPDSNPPMVVSSGVLYLEIAYYAPQDLRRGLYNLVDPEAALRYAGTDSVDLSLQVVRRYVQMQVEEYREFASKHREFLLIAGGGLFDWWPRRLREDGHDLRLLTGTGGSQVYKVTLKP